jgi:RND family efflux transporter MFP subunit
MGAAVLVGGAWLIARADVDRAGVQVPIVAPPPVTVSTPLVREVTEWDEFTGQFAAVEYVEIRARVSGFLQTIHFEDGQLVKQGDPLFVIDPRPFEIAKASADAQLAQAAAKLDLAEKQLARAAALRARDVVAASNFEERQAEVRSSQGQLDSAKAAVRSAELNLEFTRVTAPRAGRVGRHEVSIGNLITGGADGASTLLTSIVALDPLFFYFDMSESDLLAYQRAFERGKMQSTRDTKVPVFVRLIDEPNWPRQGVIDFVDNQVNRSTGTIRVRASIPNPDFFVTPGQFARLRLPGSEPYNAMLVPDEAVVSDQSRKVVMTVKEDGSVEPKVVRPGPMIDGLRVIRDGLDEKDRVIINGLLRARPGAKVTPRPGKIEPVAGAS